MVYYLATVLLFTFMTGQERSTESPLSLDERTLVWLDRVSKHPKGGELKDKWTTEDLLTQGYQLFFEILEPLKETEWLQAEHPDLHYRTWLDSRFDDRVSEFRELFGRDFGVVLNHSWGVEIYGYRKESFGDGVDARVRLSCGQQGTHGEKMLRVLYSPPREGSYSRPHGQMNVEDTTASWVRSGENGAVTTEREQNLYDFPGLSLCKLAVVLADSFAKDQATKLQPQVAQSA